MDQNKTADNRGEENGLSSSSAGDLSSGCAGSDGQANHPLCEEVFVETCTPLHNGRGGVTMKDTTIPLIDEITYSRSAEMVRGVHDTVSLNVRQSRARTPRSGSSQSAGRRCQIGSERHLHQPHSLSGTRDGGGRTKGNSTSHEGNTRKSHSCTAQSETLRTDHEYEKPNNMSFGFPSMYEELLRTLEMESSTGQESSSQTDRELAMLMSETLSGDDEGETSIPDSLLFRIFANSNQYTDATENTENHEDMVETKNSPLASAERGYRPAGHVNDIGGSSNQEHECNLNEEVVLEQGEHTEGNLELDINVGHPASSLSMQQTLPAAQTELLTNSKIGFVSVGSNTHAEEKPDFIVNGDDYADEMEDLPPHPQSKLRYTCRSPPQTLLQETNACSQTRAQNTLVVESVTHHLDQTLGADIGKPASYAQLEEAYLADDTMDGCDLQSNNGEIVDAPMSVKQKPMLKRCVPSSSEIENAIKRAIDTGVLISAEQDARGDVSKTKCTDNIRSEKNSNKCEKYKKGNSSASKPMGFIKLTASENECEYRRVTSIDTVKARQRLAKFQDSEESESEEYPQHYNRPGVKRGPLYRKPEVSPKNVASKNIPALSKGDVISPPPNSPVRNKTGITFSDPVAIYVTDCNTNMTVSSSTEAVIESDALIGGPINAEIQGQQQKIVASDGVGTAAPGAGGDISESGDKPLEPVETPRNTLLTGIVVKEDTEPLTNVSASQPTSPCSAPVEIVPKPTLTSHPSILLKPRGYLDFFSFLKSKKPVKKEVRQPKSKIFKLQKMMTDVVNAGSSNVLSSTALGESEEAKPLFPRGREVPPGWEPGQHASHPITRISAEYEMAAQRPAKSKKNQWKKTKLPRKSRRPVAEKPVRISTSDISLGMDSTNLEKESRRRRRHSKQVQEYVERSSSDEMMTHSEFDRKRRYYERQQKRQQQRSKSHHSSGREGHAREKRHHSKPKKVTEQVRFLKTIDDICNAAEDEKEDGFDDYGDEFLDPEKIMEANCAQSLTQYYTKHVKISKRLGENLHSTRGLRIVKGNYQVPSTISLERLKSIRPSTPTDIFKRSNSLNSRKHHSHPNLPIVSAKWPEASVDYGSNRQTPKKSTNSPSPSHFGIGQDYRNAWEQLRSNFVEKNAQLSKVTITNFASDLRHHTTLGKEPAEEKKRHTNKADKVSSHRKGSGSTKPPTNATHKEKSSNYKLTQVPKLPPPPNRSEEDTWCYSVNAMLLKAKQVGEVSSKGTHRFPRHNSAAVVSPVIEQKASSSFLKTLLKQDAEEVRRSKQEALASKDAGLKKQRERIRTAVSKGSGSLGKSLTAANSMGNNSTRHGGSGQSSSPAGRPRASSFMQQRNNLLDMTAAQSAAHALQMSTSAGRIQKPLDLTQPHNRERLSMEHFAFQNRSSNKSTEEIVRPNYVVEKTLQYFDYPYITERSIVPMFGNTNNNATVGKSDVISSMEEMHSDSYKIDDMLPKSPYLNTSNSEDTEPTCYIPDNVIRSITPPIKEKNNSSVRMSESAILSMFEQANTTEENSNDFEQNPLKGQAQGEQKEADDKHHANSVVVDSRTKNRSKKTNKKALNKSVVFLKESHFHTEGRCVMSRNKHQRSIQSFKLGDKTRDICQPASIYRDSILVTTTTLHVDGTLSTQPCKECTRLPDEDVKQILLNTNSNRLEEECICQCRENYSIHVTKLQLTDSICASDKTTYSLTLGKNNNSHPDNRQRTKAKGDGRVSKRQNQSDISVNGTNRGILHQHENVKHMRNASPVYGNPSDPDYMYVKPEYGDTHGIECEYPNPSPGRITMSRQHVSRIFSPCITRPPAYSTISTESSVSLPPVTASSNASVASGEHTPSIHPIHRKSKSSRFRRSVGVGNSYPTPNKESTDIGDTVAVGAPDSSLATNQYPEHFNDQHKETTNHTLEDNYGADGVEIHSYDLNEEKDKHVARLCTMNRDTSTLQTDQLYTSHYSDHSEDMQPPPPTPMAITRENLRCMRVSDIAKTLIHRRDQLNLALEAVTKSSHYVPAVRMYDWHPSQTVSLVVKVLNCSRHMDRPARSKEGGIRPSLTVFYTQHNTYEPARIYTIEVIEAGFYSLLNKDIISDDSHVGIPKLGSLVQYHFNAEASIGTKDQFPLLLLGEPIDSKEYAIRKVTFARDMAMKNGDIITLAQQLGWNTPPSQLSQISRYPINRSRFMTDGNRSVALSVTPNTFKTSNDTSVIETNQKVIAENRQDILRGILAAMDSSSVDTVVQNFQSLAQQQPIPEGCGSAVTFSPVPARRGHATFTVVSSGHQFKPRHRNINLTEKYTPMLRSNNEDKTKVSSWEVSASGLAYLKPTVTGYQKKPAKQIMMDNETSTHAADIHRTVQSSTTLTSAKGRSSSKVSEQTSWWWKQPHHSETLKTSLRQKLGANRRCGLPPVKSNVQGKVPQKHHKGGDKKGVGTCHGISIAVPTSDSTHPSSNPDANLSGWEWPNPVVPPPFPEKLRVPKTSKSRVKTRGPPVNHGRGNSRAKIGIRQLTRSKRRVKNKVRDRSVSSGPSASSSSSDDNDEESFLAKKSLGRPRSLADIFTRILDNKTSLFGPPSQNIQNDDDVLGYEGDASSVRKESISIPRNSGGGDVTSAQKSGAYLKDAENIILDDGTNEAEYDLLKDAQEARDMWRTCFPPVKFSQKKQRWRKVKSNMKTPILSSAESFMKGKTDHSKLLKMMVSKLGSFK